MKNQKKCAECGGKVFLTTNKSTIEHPAHDERGRPIYERVLNKVTRQIEERQVMVTWNIRGLGTWYCQNGCKGKVKVKAA